jgi:hypothetical protein
VSFKSNVSDIKYDIENERDEKIDQFTKDQDDWNDFAEQLENSDNKVVKKTGKAARFVATLFGLAGAFVGAKYGSKLAIETLKSVANNGSSKKIIESLKGLKEPATKVIKSIGDNAKKVAETPFVKENLAKLENSKFGQVVSGFVKNEKVAKVLEPVKNTLKSMKDIKIDGNKIQNFIENTMAVTTTGSVLVDDLAGRNNDKSTVELASGV